MKHTARSTGVGSSASLMQRSFVKSGNGRMRGQNEHVCMRLGLCQKLEMHLYLI
jgi:hypothetical protein